MPEILLSPDGACRTSCFCFLMISEALFRSLLTVLFSLCMLLVSIQINIERLIFTTINLPQVYLSKRNAQKKGWKNGAKVVPGFNC